MPYTIERKNEHEIVLILEPGSPAQQLIEVDLQDDLSIHFCLFKMSLFLKQTRKRLGLTISAVHAGTGLSKSHISIIEAASAKGPPTPRILKKLADFYGIGTDTLLLLAGATPLPTTAAETSREFDPDSAFQRLIFHPALRPEGLEHREVRWLAPAVKQHWMSFTRKLLRAVQDESVDVSALLKAIGEEP